MGCEYISDVLGVAALTNARDEIVALFNRFEEDVQKLETNAGDDDPGSASSCGVSNKSLGVLEAAAALSSANGVANIVLDDGRKIELIAPSEEAIAALSSDNKKSKKVDGEVTGMGLGDERGHRLEVGRGISCTVIGLGLEEAFGHVRTRVHLTGIATWDRDGAVYVIDNPMYSDKLDL